MKIAVACDHGGLRLKNVLIDEMKKQKGISEIMFVITERVFYVTSDRLGEKKTRKRIDTALDKAGLTLCKDFRLCSLMVCD